MKCSFTFSRLALRRCLITSVNDDGGAIAKLPHDGPDMTTTLETPSTFSYILQRALIYISLPIRRGLYVIRVISTVIVIATL